MAVPSTVLDIVSLRQARSLAHAHDLRTRESPFHARWPIHVAISVYSFYSDRRSEPLGTNSVKYSMAL